MSDLQSPIKAKQRIFLALTVRFIIGRYGRDNIGFLWTIVEPMLLCVGVMVIWVYTKASSNHGVNVVAFVLTGYMPLTLWRHQTNHMVNFLRNVKFLTIFRGVTVMDAMLARLTLEFLSCTGAFIIVFAALYAAEVIQAPHDWGQVILGWLMMGAYSGGVGILIAALSEVNHLVEKLNQPVQYFLIPFCGCFYLVDWFPESAREYLLMLPLVHPYEILRGGYFGPEVNTYGSVSYVLFWSIVTAGLGFTLFERVKDNIEA